MSKKYILIVTVTVSLLLAGVTGFNAIVDPYGMYRLVEIKGLNAHKPAIYNRVRLFKAYDVRRIKPEAIVLGTSRSHIAIRMSHEGWDAAAAPRYNMSFDGATTREMYFYLRHAYSVHPLKQVVLGLDTYHPMRVPCIVRPDFDPGFLLETRSLTSLLRMYLEDLKLLTSVDTFMASVNTIRSQDLSVPEWFAGDGQRLGAVYFRNFERTFQKSPRAYFENTDKLEVGYNLEERNPNPPLIKDAPETPAAPSLQDIDDETSLGYIWRIMEFCRARHVDLRMYITPNHAHQMEITAAVGAWPSIEKAKRNLVYLLSKDAAMHPGEPPIPLYDFSGYNSVTTEPLPGPGSQAEMKYYWDSSHFKEIVGDFVLDRLFGVSNPKRLDPADFGVRLTAVTIDAVLARIRDDQIEYRKKHPQDTAAIHMLVDKALRKAEQ